MFHQQAVHLPPAHCGKQKHLVKNSCKELPAAPTTLQIFSPRTVIHRDCFSLVLRGASFSGTKEEADSGTSSTPSATPELHKVPSPKPLSFHSLSLVGLTSVLRSAWSCCDRATPDGSPHNTRSSRGGATKQLNFRFGRAGSEAGARILTPPSTWHPSTHPGDTSVTTNPRSSRAAALHSRPRWVTKQRPTHSPSWDPPGSVGWRHTWPAA